MIHSESGRATAAVASVGEGGGGGGSGGAGDPLAQASTAINEKSGDSWKPGSVAAWQHEAEAMQLDQEIIQTIYVDALQEVRYDSAALQEGHALEGRAVASLDPR